MTNGGRHERCVQRGHEPHNRVAVPPRTREARTPHTKDNADLYEPEVVQAQLAGLPVENVADVRRLAEGPEPAQSEHAA